MDRGELPSGRSEEWRIAGMAESFTLGDGKLYKSVELKDQMATREGGSE
jgi:hypothetical protein